MLEPVLTVRQPWASATFHAGKTVESRRKRTHYRGRLWIHAGTYSRRDQADHWAADPDLWLPDEPLPRGVILGLVELVDWVDDSDSPWALPDNFHWVLRSPMLLVRPVPHSGSLGFSWRRQPRGELRGARRHRRSCQ
jgi:hypothetical protein